MSQKVANRTTGLVDYKELETNILSSIREGRPLTGRGDTVYKKAAGGKLGR
ncbi:putative transposase [Wolbachia endosymbiont of Cylisticus convexus]|nr:putative transposase [Wolbachia endosymbiont of Cylisticus convexus]